MDVFANGIITIVNGLRAVTGGLVNPLSVMAILTAAGLVWLALIELDEINRQGTKPEIERGR
jgi:hypothetical protein